ncbi:IS5 family transposase (plasmid) [Roseomonas sp. OT10]|uniref:IS5 family transposase n=1 Tax=Roseomonas cutis TaxID=2897332 RepID=UPI001E645799|nr:IS5 family transposase [Roseomonas sp. OT10]UFN51590.1 IS5 family transposase [Roseomonas sp. OT10]
MHLHDPDALRRFVGACFLVLRQGCSWAELGCLVPSADAARRRFRRWARKGVFERLFQSSQPRAAPDVLHVDSTSVKCHRTSTGARGGGEEGIGRSRGGLTSKVHHAVDGLGFVRRLLVTPGQQADCRHAGALTEGLQPVFVVGDRAYDTDTLRGHWHGRGIGVCVPPRRNRVVRHAYDEALYRTRHLVENAFNRLKDFRRMSLRLDKTHASFRAFACLAAALINWRLAHNLVRRA